MVWAELRPAATSVRAGRAGRRPRPSGAPGPALRRRYRAGSSAWPAGRPIPGSRPARRGTPVIEAADHPLDRLSAVRRLIQMSEQVKLHLPVIVVLAGVTLTDDVRPGVVRLSTGAWPPNFAGCMAPTARMALCRLRPLLWRGGANCKATVSAVLDGWRRREDADTGRGEGRRDGFADGQVECFEVAVQQQRRYGRVGGESDAGEWAGRQDLPDLRGEADDCWCAGGWRAECEVFGPVEDADRALDAR